REAKRVLAGAKDRLQAIAAQLEAVSPMATIARGFAIVSRHDGVLVDHVEAVRPGDAITILVSDGSVEGVVSGTRRTTG
ncbi:MAG: exodeoxyribonuclease VII large subunit, partial [Candidatus Thermoplasmatota archaeon]